MGTNRVVGCTFAYLVLMAAVPASSQQRRLDRPDALPIRVRGAETPARIPDHLAYAHFVLEAAISRSAPPSEISRRDALLARVELSSRDRRALVSALEGVKERLDALASLTAACGATPLPDAKRLRNLNVRREKVLDAARRRVRAALSPGGLGALDAYLNATVKPQITVFANRP